MTQQSSTPVPREPHPNSISAFLRAHLDSREFSCLQWVNAERGIASLTWKRGGKDEMQLFEKWRTRTKNGEIEASTKPSQMKHNFDMAIKRGAGVEYLNIDEMKSLLGLSDVQNMKYIRIEHTVTSPAESSPPHTDNSPQQIDVASTHHCHSEATPGSANKPATAKSTAKSATKPTAKSATKPTTAKSATKPGTAKSATKPERRTQPQSLQPQSQPQRLQPQSQPQSLLPQSQPRSQPQSLQPQSQPQSQLLASALENLRICDRPRTTVSVERPADHLIADSAVVDNRELLEQLNRSKLLRDCVLPESIGDQREEFVVVVRCEGRIECAQIVKTNCRLVLDRNRPRGPDGIRQFALCRRDNQELQTVTRQILESCEGGLLIVCDGSGNLFVTRHTRKCVYWRKPYDIAAPFIVLRRRDDMTRIFDSTMYCDSLRRGNCSPEVLLNLGNIEDIEYSNLLVTVMSRKAHQLYTAHKRNAESSDSDDGYSVISCE